MIAKRDDRGRPVYMISVAAELTGLHPQTLRIYERKELVNPQRSPGNTRLYSDEDIERLRLITELTDEGVNLAGVACILEMQDEVVRMERKMEEMKRRVEEIQRVAAQEMERLRRESRADLVHVRRGRIVRREGQ
jgi:MerR family transcriptional regulator/heat shock protein HspR